MSSFSLALSSALMDGLCTFFVGVSESDSESDSVFFFFLFFALAEDLALARGAPFLEVVSVALEITFGAKPSLLSVSLRPKGTNAGFCRNTSRSARQI